MTGLQALTLDLAALKAGLDAEKDAIANARKGRRS